MPMSPTPIPRRRRIRAGRALLAAALLCATPVLAQSSGTGKEDKSCAQYGAGFQRVPGSTSCVRTGASVRTDAFSGGAPGTAGNQFNGTPTGASGTATQNSDPWKTTR
ncbi:hypothetical protein V5F49_18040 [Xanthobacter sp. V3C-3]|uniref:hypothetical protein n=1 Tax=Xanthobacter lutulentifluminis TaxID=3119935 RepID=UPI00372B9D0B